MAGSRRGSLLSSRSSFPRFLISSSRCSPSRRKDWSLVISVDVFTDTKVRRLRTPRPCPSPRQALHHNPSKTLTPPRQHEEKALNTLILFNHIKLKSFIVPREDLGERPAHSTLSASPSPSQTNSGEKDHQRTGLLNTPFSRGKSPRYSRPDEG